MRPKISISISISFSIAQTPTVRPRAHYIVIISCYSEQYARLKRSVFSPRRKADVNCVLFSSVGSWFHDLGAAVENGRSAVFRFVRGMTQSPRLASRSVDRDEVAATAGVTSFPIIGTPNCVKWLVLSYQSEACFKIKHLCCMQQRRDIYALQRAGPRWQRRTEWGRGQRGTAADDGLRQLHGALPHRHVRHQPRRTSRQDRIHPDVVRHVWSLEQPRRKKTLQHSLSC